MATFKGIKLQSLLCALKSLAALGTKVSLVLLIINVILASFDQIFSIFGVYSFI